MSDPINDQPVETLEQAKADGGTRLDRIQEIVKTAAAQVFAEVKEGTSELGAIAQNRITTVTDNLNSTPNDPPGETPAESAGQWTGSTFSNLILSLFNALKQRLRGLDTQLHERYGDRYQSAKQRMEESATWYRTTLDKAKASNPAPTKMDEKQAEMEAKLTEVGATVAQREQQLLQQVRELVQSASAKR